MIAECLHRRSRCRHIIMILWTAHILLIQLANDRWKKGVKWKKQTFLAFLLFYQTLLGSECEASILFTGSVISDNHTSVVSFTDRSDHHSTLSPQMNLYTVAAAVASNEGTDSMHIIRNNLGDTFYDDDQSWTSCSADKCTSRSSGTATVAIEANVNSDGKKLLLNRYSNNFCYCRCLQNLPAFREDMHVCVDDVLECSLVSFVIGNSQQKIPYVFLPLKGQIVYPNAEITFNGLKSTPTCIISRVRYLTPSGWYDIKNYSISGSDQSSMPFKVFHDERRTFLQWLGNAELRANLEGRLLLIDLICKERDSQLIFTPCISFRVAGVPSMKTILTESAVDENKHKNQNAGFSSNEYIALGLATLLLAMIYIASVFLYLHLKKNKMKEKSSRRENTFRKYINIEDNGSHLFGENQSKKLIVEEEGLIKNNPLLMKRYYPNSIIEIAGASSMDGNRLAEENTFCSLTSNTEKNNFAAEKMPESLNKQNKVVSAMVHPRAVQIASLNVKRYENAEPQRWQMFANKSLNPFSPHFMQKNENSDFLARNKSERQQQTDTNNIEEKHPDENISIVECPEDVVQNNSRHKLYFNPAYFEPELLMAPPPAAVEFLTKIREVMTIAKRKMSMKKFLPSLTRIPEEHQSYVESRCSLETDNQFHLTSDKNEKSNENEVAKRNTVAQSENSDLRLDEDKEKRQIIQKWLQSIPSVPHDTCNHVFKNKNDFKVTTEGNIRQQNGDLSNKTSNEPVTNDKSQSGNNAANVPSDKTNQNQSQLYENAFMENINKESPPTLPKRESPEQYKPKVPVRRKSAIMNKNPATGRVHEAVQKLDNRDDSRMNNSFDDYGCADAISSNANMANGNNFSSSLPLDEELTMHNAIYNVVTGSTTLSKLKSRYDTKNTTTAPFTDDTFNSRHNLDGKYSLVSEVYVNDGYNSGETSLSSFNSSGEGENDAKKVSSLSRKNAESSRLMIQLNDCPFFYSVENADDFEPDTLDRKPNKDNEDNTSTNQMNFVDSLERPAISLRTYGSFRQDSSHRFGTSNSNLKRTFGSLQEIYEARRKSELENNRSTCDFDDDSPRSLTTQLENSLWRRDKCTSRHRYRQRKQSSPPPLPPVGSSLPYIPPKIAKPPLPPRRSEISTFSEFRKPDMSSSFKANSCSVLDAAGLRSNNFVVENKLNVCFNNNVWTYRPEDSGYLSSSDSEKSKIFAERKNPLHQCNVANGNMMKPGNEDEEDDDDDDDDGDSLSCCNDGNSESGAESIETNFKFYKNRGKSGRENGEIRDQMENPSHMISQH